MSDGSVVRPIDLSSLDEATLGRLIDAVRQRHHFQGAAIALETPLLGLRLPSGLIKRSNRTQTLEFNLFRYCSRGLLGSSLGFKARFADGNRLANVSISRHDPAFDSLRAGRFAIVFLDNSGPVFANQVDYAHDEKYEEQWHLVKEHQSLIDEPLAHYWETISCLRHELKLDFAPNNLDHLSAGWVTTYRARAVDLQNQLSSAAVNDGLSRIRNTSSESLRACLDSIRDSGRQLAPVFKFLCKQCGVDSSCVLELYAYAEQLIHHQGIGEVASFVRELLETYLASSEFTNCGKAICWFDPVNQTIERLVLDVEQFPGGFAPSNYWERLLWDLPFGWGYIVTAAEVPIDPRQIVESASGLPRADDIEHVESTANLLLDEALAEKRFTIPPGAVVELPFGPFVFIEVREVESRVFFKFLNRDGEYYVAAVNPSSHSCSFIFPKTDIDVNAELKGAIESGVKLILAAVVRDFWVVEQREAIFGCRRSRNGELGQSQSDSTKPRIIYLPRVKYSTRLDVNTCEESLGHRERRTHFVSGHIRKATNPSPAQLILAERLGKEVPSGYTFVRPHERGQGARDVIYRSRSALRSLYVVDETVPSDGETPDWFQFEREVHELMLALGFTVEHVSASRRGDDGVDVFATKGHDLDQVNWIIQCKCYSPKNKIGPSIVRELAGTLVRYPAGTRGMIVATSAFTKKSVEEAALHNIRLMDGVEFKNLRLGQVGL